MVSLVVAVCEGFGQAHLFVRGGCSGTVQIRASERQFKTQKKAKKGESLNRQ